MGKISLHNSFLLCGVNSYITIGYTIARTTSLEWFFFYFCLYQTAIEEEPLFLNFLYF